jgi:hypothetical protein
MGNGSIDDQGSRDDSGGCVPLKLRAAAAVYARSNEGRVDDKLTFSSDTDAEVILDWRER